MNSDGIHLTVARLYKFRLYPILGSAMTKIPVIAARLKLRL